MFNTLIYFNSSVNEIDEKPAEPEQVDKDLEKMEKAIENIETPEPAAEGDNAEGTDTNVGADNTARSNDAGGNVE